VGIGQLGDPGVEQPATQHPAAQRGRHLGKRGDVEVGLPRSCCEQSARLPIEHIKIFL